MHPQSSPSRVKSGRLAVATPDTNGVLSPLKIFTSYLFGGRSAQSREKQQSTQGFPNIISKAGTPRPTIPLKSQSTPPTSSNDFLVQPTASAGMPSAIANKQKDLAAMEEEVQTISRLRNKGKRKLRDVYDVLDSEQPPEDKPIKRLRQAKAPITAPQTSVGRSGMTATTSSHKLSTAHSPTNNVARASRELSIVIGAQKRKGRGRPRKYPPKESPQEDALQEVDAASNSGDNSSARDSSEVQLADHSDKDLVSNTPVQFSQYLSSGHQYYPQTSQIDEIIKKFEHVGHAYDLEMQTWPCEEVTRLKTKIGKQLNQQLVKLEKAYGDINHSNAARKKVLDLIEGLQTECDEILTTNIGHELSGIKQSNRELTRKILTDLYFTLIPKVMAVIKIALEVHTSNSPIGTTALYEVKALVDSLYQLLNAARSQLKDLQPTPRVSKPVCNPSNRQDPIVVDAYN